MGTTSVETWPPPCPEEGSVLCVVFVVNHMVVLFHFQMSTPNQIFTHVPPTCVASSFFVLTPGLVVRIQL
jgi:hypothetical protein